jgi:hypothetical protein
MTKQTKRVVRRWTEEELNVLRTMYHAGVAHSEISRMLNRSVGAVQQRAHYEGLTSHRATKKYVSDTLTMQEMRDYADEISLDVAPNKPWWRRMLGL